MTTQADAYRGHPRSSDTFGGTSDRSWRARGSHTSTCAGRRVTRDFSVECELVAMMPSSGCRPSCDGPSTGACPTQHVCCLMASAPAPIRDRAGGPPCRSRHVSRFRRRLIRRELAGRRAAARCRRRTLTARNPSRRPATPSSRADKVRALRGATRTRAKLSGQAAWPSRRCLGG